MAWIKWKVERLRDDISDAPLVIDVWYVNFCFCGWCECNYVQLLEGCGVDVDAVAFFSLSLSRWSCGVVVYCCDVVWLSGCMIVERCCVA